MSKAEDKRYSVETPADREIIAICDLIVEAHEKEALIIVLTETQQYSKYLLEKVASFTKWDSNKVKIYRNHVRVEFGGIILFRSKSDSGLLHGINPTKIVLFGELGEFYTWLVSHIDATIVGIE